MAKSGFLFWISTALIGFISSSPYNGSSYIQEAIDVSDSELSSFDYIVVGGGTAGSPLAATLSSKYNVLVLERGGSPYNNPNLTRIENYGRIFSDTGPEAPLPVFFSAEGVINGKPRVLGGGSSVNAGLYSRAEQYFISDLGLNEWLVNKSYQWVESSLVTIPKELGPYQRALRAALLEAGVTPDNNSTLDHIVGTKTTGSIFDESGTRRPASNLFTYANPANIKVLLHATVERVLFEGQHHPKAYGVQFRDKLGRVRRALLSTKKLGDIILSAGAITSPQLLMLSGIGSSINLRAVGIEVVKDLPEVGKHMADNPSLYLTTPSPSFVETSTAVVVGITSFGSYLEANSGGTLAPGAGFLAEKVNGPVSEGALSLVSNKIDDDPSVRFNYFQAPRDLEVCVGGLDAMEKLLLSQAYAPFRFDNQSMPSGGTVSSPSRLNSSMSSIRETLARYCKQNVATIYHYHGGCLVGKVVDRSFKVLGVDRLRVVDGSVFSVSPGTNPQATLMMLGRYVGKTIVDDGITTCS